MTAALSRPARSEHPMRFLQVHHPAPVCPLETRRLFRQVSALGPPRGTQAWHRLHQMPRKTLPRQRKDEGPSPTPDGRDQQAAWEPLTHPWVSRSRHRLKRMQETVAPGPAAHCGRPGGSDPGALGKPLSTTFPPLRSGH